MQKLFKGGNYSRAETIRGNTVRFLLLWARNFKFQVQDSDLEYFFMRFEKQIALSEKSHL